MSFSISSEKTKRLLAIVATWGFLSLLCFANYRWSSTEIVFSLGSDKSGLVQIFFDVGQGYAEAFSQTQPLKVGMNSYRFHLPRSKIRSLRLDPSTTAGITAISAVTVLRDGRPMKTFPLEALIGANQIELSGPAGGMLQVRIPDDASDPQILVRDSAIDATQRSIDYGSYILFALLISLAVLYWQPKSRIEPSRDSGLSVPWSIPLALFAFGLMTALAVVSTTEYSVHPDEFSHITAARYYVHNWLPPKVGDPESLASYSGYGASYLNEFDVVYFFAARFSAMIGPIFGTNDVILLRFFALLLFIPVIAILFSKSSKAWIAVPVLITPQCWYVYSYFNADSFALTVAVVFAWYVASTMESIGKIEGAEMHPIRFVLPLAVLLSLTLLSKLNFVPLIYFYGAILLVGARMLDGKTLLLSGVACILLIWIYFTSGVAANHAPAATSILFVWGALGASILIAGLLMVRTYNHGTVNKRFVLLSMAALMAGLVVAGTRPAYDAIVNGSWRERNANLAALTERLAVPAFKPSNSTHPDWHSPILYLRSQGVPIYEVFAEKNWVGISATSFFGVYGYMNIFAQPFVYTVLGCSFILICLVACFGVLRNRDLRLFALASFISAVLIVQDSLLTSWVRDFQAQGRYLFPLLCILGLMLYWSAQRVDIKKSQYSLLLIKTAVIVSFLFGAGSFVFALRLIPK